MSITGRYITIRGGNIIGTPPNNIPITYSYLYDIAAFQGGFSLYKLNSTYTGNCMRVRRVSDNAEMEIGFLDNFLDIATLLAFAGGNTCRVVKWYSQEVSGLFASQTSGTVQPLIVDAGVMVTNPVGNYAMDFVVGGSQNSLLVFSSGAMYNNKSFAMGVSIISDTITNARRDIWGWTKSFSGFSRFSFVRGFSSSGRSEIRAARLDADAVIGLISPTPYPTGKILTTNIIDYANADAFLRENGVQVASNLSFLTTGNTSAIDSYNTMAMNNSSGIGIFAATQPVKYISEVIFYNTDVMANLTDIEDNVNTRHNVY
jgi:hypothetical protein